MSPATWDICILQLSPRPTLFSNLLFVHSRQLRDNIEDPESFEETKEKSKKRKLDEERDAGYKYLKLLDSQEQEEADREFLDQLDEESKETDIEEEEDIPPNMEVVDEFFNEVEENQMIKRARNYQKLPTMAAMMIKYGYCPQGTSAIINGYLFDTGQVTKTDHTKFVDCHKVSRSRKKYQEVKRKVILCKSS